MHEFSLCQSLLKQAAMLAPTLFKKQAKQPVANGNIVISALTVRLGLFAGVDKHLLKRAFDAALHDVHRKWSRSHQNSFSHSNLDRFLYPSSNNSSLNNSTSKTKPQVVFAPFTQLVIEEASTTVYCKTCDQHFSITQKHYRESQLSCRNNPQHKTILTSGDELLLVNVKMHLEEVFPPLHQLLQPRPAAQG